MKLACRPALSRHAQALLALLALHLQPVQAQRITVVELPALAGNDVLATALNNRGDVVGSLYDVPLGVGSAFVWTAGAGLQNLGTLGAAQAVATGINDRGQIIGNRSSAGVDSAWQIDPGQAVAALPNLVSAAAINQRGDVLGFVQAGSYAGVYRDGLIRTSVVNPDGSLRLGGLDEQGRFSGAMYWADQARSEPFLYSDNDGAMRLFPAGASRLRWTGALALSPTTGTVAGTFAPTASANTHAFIATATRFVDLTPLLPAGQRAAAYSVNDAGMVAGFVGSGSTTRATLWVNGRSTDLQTLAGISASSGASSSGAVAVNAAAQVLINHDTAAGLAGATLLTLQPDWEGGNGRWAGSAQWNYGSTGAVALAPGAVHDVVIRPAGSATVLGAAQAEVQTLTVGGNVGHIVSFDLDGGSTRTRGGTWLAAQGVMTGSGRLEGALLVDAGARVEVGAGQRLQLVGGDVDHSGALRVAGAGAVLDSSGGFTNRAAGEVRVSQGTATFGGAFSNEGRVVAIGADLGFAGGLANSGELNVSFGHSQIAGPLANGNSGRIVVSNGAQASLLGALANAGELRVSAGGAANVFGVVSGNGRITGSGQLRLEGGLVAGSSTRLQVDPQATFGAGAVSLMGLGDSGTSDTLAFTQTALLEGGTLQVRWAGSGSAAAGARWDLFDWNGGVSGHFDTLALPALDAGLAWDSSALYTSGLLTVTAVPEPAAWLLWLTGLLALPLRRRPIRKPASFPPVRINLHGVRMKHRIPFALSALALAAALLSPAAQAQGIINIQGFGSDGAGANISSYPVAPGTLVSLFNPVLVNFAAGDYQLSSAWGLPGATYNTWNFQSSAPGSWASHFVAAEVLGGGQYRLLLDGVSLLDPTCRNHFCAWDTEAQATAAFLATPPFLLHLDNAATVAFASADYFLPDNLGGISLQVTPVPEPERWAMLALGLALLAWRRRPAS